VLHREDSTASSRRRSLHDARRSLESLPRIITSSAESDPRSTYHVPTFPLLVIHSPPASRRGSLANGTSAGKNAEDLDVIEDRQEESSSNLDLSSMPLRVIYSPSVSRSGSVGHSDRPSIILSHDDGPEADVQILSPDDDSAQARSFEASALSTGNVHRRSRTNSYASNVDASFSTSNYSSPNPGRPSSPTGRLAFEESGNRDHIHSPPVFVAFRQTKWFRPMSAAKSILAFVCCAVLGNLIYT
jgi:hypothetical protein